MGMTDQYRNKVAGTVPASLAKVAGQVTELTEDALQLWAQT